MDVKNTVILESNKDGHIFQFILPNGATYGIAFDAVFDILNELMKMQQESLKKTQDSYNAATEGK